MVPFGSESVTIPLDMLYSEIRFKGRSRRWKQNMTSNQKEILKPMNPSAYGYLRYSFCLMLTNEFDTATHCITNLLNPLTTNDDGCRNFHGYCKLTEVLCWHMNGDKDERMVIFSCKTKIGCGKEPVRTHTLPITAANKWRQERVHSTEKTTLIPLHRPSPLPRLRPSARRDVSVWSRILIQDSPRKIKSWP
jgi:hypothetical protein